MRKSLHLSLLALALCCIAADWRVAEPGWDYDFPRDHRIHPEFKTEWWYFTGNVAGEGGQRFGYELTFFRHGITPLAQRDTNASRFVVGDLKFAHFAITDVAKQRFRFEQKISRGAFGEAGFNDGKRLAWIDDWTLATNGDDGFELVATLKEGATLHLHLRATKPPVIHGQGGVSAKASGDGHASHYYSMTRLETAGELLMGGKSQSLVGESWFDHEWASNQLAAGQIGWDWLSVHFDDGSELMLYQMRLENGTDPTSSGSLIAPDGTSRHLPSTSFRMTPTGYWASSATKAKYPIAWRVELPEHEIEIAVKAAVENQELAFLPLVYWEGAIDVTGKRAGKPINGRGYLELTGYAGPLRELQR